MRCVRYQYEIDRAGGGGPHPWLTNMAAFKTALGLTDATVSTTRDLEADGRGTRWKAYAFTTGIVIERARTLSGQPAGHAVHSVVTLFLEDDWTDTEVTQAVTDLFSATTVHTVIIDRTNVRE